MIFGLEVASVGLLHLAASGRTPFIECTPKIVPKIKVLPSKSEVKYDFTKSKYDLERFDIDTVSPYQRHQKTHVGGLMSGKIQLTYQTEFMQETYDRYQMGCVYIKQINVKMHIEPTIYVASDHKRGTCRHEAILAHEKKHVREDQLIVNKYARIIGNDIKAALNASGYSFGPYSTRDIPARQERLQGKLEQLVKTRHNQMESERQKRQQAIDSLQEYERVRKVCE